MHPEHTPHPWVYHVTVWLGDQCTVSLGCEAVGIGEATAILAGRSILARQFPDYAAVVATGPAAALPLHMASDGELLHARVRPSSITD
jgi:hypothetical protein